MFDSLWPPELQHARLPCPSLSPWVCSSSCPLGQWCIQLSLPLFPPPPPALIVSQHQGLLWVSSSHRMANVLELHLESYQWISSVQSLSRVWLFVTPWTAAHQASLSITNSWSLLKLMSVELVMPSNHLILCHPLLLLLSIFPSIGVFHMSQFFTSGGQNIGVLDSASVLPVNIQG